MASAYSTLHNYASLPVYTPDLTLVLEGLKYKQGKYDENREKLQSTLDKYSMLDVVKDEDEDYLVDKLKKVEEITNRYTHMDLSSDALTQSLIRNMGQVLDENVKTAVLSSKVYRNEKAAWNKLKEDNPDKYAEQNYQFAQQGAQSWLSDGKVGSAYNGGGGVIEYIDVDDVIREGMKDLKDVYQLEYVEVEGVEGSMFRDVNERKAATPERVRQALNSLLGPKEIRQLGIDAWATYDNYSSEDISNIAKERQNLKIDAYADNVTKLESLLSNPDNLTDAEKQFYQNQLEESKINLQNAKDKPFGGLDVSNKETAYTSLYINDYIDNFVDLYSYDVITDTKVYENDKEMYDALTKIEESKKTGTTSTLDDITAFEGKEVTITLDEDDPTSPFETIEKLSNDAISNTEQLLGIQLDQSNLSDFYTVFSEENLLSNIGGTTDFNGKTIELTPENIAAIISAKNALSGKYMDIYDDTNMYKIDNMASTLAQLTAAYYMETGGEDAVVDMDPTELIFPNFLIRKNDKGVYERIDTEDGAEFYLPLLNKYGKLIIEKGEQKALNSLTKDEKLNLELLLASQTIIDQDTDETVTKTVEHTLKYKILKDVSQEVSQSIIDDLDIARESIQGEDTPIGNYLAITGDYSEGIDKLNQWGLDFDGLYNLDNSSSSDPSLSELFDIKILNISSGRKNLLNKLKELSSAYNKYNQSKEGSEVKAENETTVKNLITDINDIIANSKNALNKKEVGFQDNYLSELTAGDVEYQIGNAEEVSLGEDQDSPTMLIKNWQKELEEKAKSSVAELSNYLTIRGVKFTSENAAYDNIIASAVDLEGDPFVPQNYKGVIQVNPELVNGQPTGNYIVLAQVDDKQKKDGYTGVGKITKEDLDRNKISIPVDTEVTNYNTDLKSGANKIYLGKGSSGYSQAIEDSNQDLFLANVNDLKSMANLLGEDAVNMTEDAIRGYKNGEYKFGIEALDINNSGNYNYYGVVYTDAGPQPIQILRDRDNQPTKMLNSKQVADFMAASKQFSSELMYKLLEQTLLEMQEIKVQTNALLNQTQRDGTIPIITRE